MNEQTIVSLKEVSISLQELMDDFKSCLDELTTDGAGLLYDLKRVVGADTQLGAAISDVGSSIMQAKRNAFNAFQLLKDEIDLTVTNAENIALDSIAKFDNAGGIVEGITFK